MLTPNTESAQESTTSPAFVSPSVDALDGGTPQVDTSQTQAEDVAENPFQPKKSKLQKSKGQQNLTVTKTLSMKETVSSVQNFQYDHSKLREIISHMIIVHELPFCFSEYELFNLAMQTATSHYQKISRAMAKKDCISSYKMEKKKLMVQLKSVNHWQLQKMTFNFYDIPPPHTGIAISVMLQKCLAEWGIEKKVWTLTVDNAANNDVVVRLLRDNLLFNGTLHLGGKIFHVRCCAHILNLLVLDGLTPIQDIIYKVRESVKYVTASEGRVNMFSEIAKQLQLSSKKLVLDFCTRWNATYFMLSAALEFKAVFPRYQQRDVSYIYLPTEEEWKRVQIVCNFLKDFKNVTDLISGSEYPTSNLFLPQLIEIKLKLGANVEELYRAGSSIGRSSSSENDVIASERGNASVLIGSNPSNYARYLQTVDDVEDLKSVLDTYFEEKVIKWKEPGHFDDDTQDIKEYTMS
ncbi:zinc finger BED domain-containing protein RICESLEEPER 2-like [Salvia miltiorrhiza]|uniref:zinc finger BED domain-containing protein RICESLEEPER 2-like n=1 Tax=Salvia miltiorrhiza TaxID=226208 RepID=UPI0025AD1D94|nr:zinc finger BED domain-containing protein RICESLEEPER 2-like [Salvia miltiorrhiza]